MRPTLYRWKEIPGQALHNLIPSQKQVQYISQHIMMRHLVCKMHVAVEWGKTFLI